MNQNDRWIAKNFDKLMELYGGRYVAVVNRAVVAVGQRPERVEKKARALAGSQQPSVLRVPQKEIRRIDFAPFRLFDLS